MNYDLELRFRQLTESTQKLMEAKLAKISSRVECTSCAEKLEGTLVDHHVEWSKGKSGYGKSNKGGPTMKLCANCHTLLHARSLLCMEYSKEGAGAYLESIENSWMIPDSQKKEMLDGYAVSYFIYNFSESLQSPFERDLFTLAVMRKEIRLPDYS